MLRLGAGALAAALLAACTMTGDPEPDPTADETAQPTATPAPSLSLAAEPPIPSGGANGLLRLGTVGEPRVPPALVYSTLVTVDPRTASIYADLAEFVEQPEPLTLTFHLNEHARFHTPAGDSGANGGGNASDPGPINATEIARDFAIRAGAGEFLFSLVVEEVTAVDVRTVQLRLYAPFALLLEQLGDADTAGVRADAPSTVGTPLGSGPFVPERQEDGSLTLRPHVSYHRLGLPMLGEIRMLAAERARALDAAFAGGALDLQALDNPDSVNRAIEERPDARILARSSRRARGLGLSLVGAKGGRIVRFDAAFQDQRVRRAFALALDRDAIAAYDESTHAGPVGPAFAADALDPTDLAGHELFQHDPQEAASLLQAAGHEGLTFALEGPLAQPVRGLAQLIARQLRAAGFVPTLELVDNARLQTDLEHGDFEAIVFELEPIRSPDIGLRLHVSGGLSGVSPWGYSNPVYDDAVRAALARIDPVERAAASRAAQQLLLEDVPAMLPLPEPVERIAIASAVGGYEYDAYEFNERGLAPLWHVGANSARVPRAPQRLATALGGRL